jgi:hypothetical protein
MCLKVAAHSYEQEPGQILAAPLFRPTSCFDLLFILKEKILGGQRMYNLRDMPCD